MPPVIQTVHFRGSGNRGQTLNNLNSVEADGDDAPNKVNDVLGFIGTVGVDGIVAVVCYIISVDFHQVLSFNVIVSLTILLLRVRIIIKTS